MALYFVIFSLLPICGILWVGHHHQHLHVPCACANKLSDSSHDYLKKTHGVGWDRIAIQIILIRQNQSLVLHVPMNDPQAEVRDPLLSFMGILI